MKCICCDIRQAESVSLPHNNVFGVDFRIRFMDKPLDLCRQCKVQLEASVNFGRMRILSDGIQR